MSLAGQRLDSRRYQIVPRTLVFAFRDGRVLLQRVPEKRGAWSGLWNGVGGHVERGESPADAARREFLEETGLEPAALKLAGTLVIDVGSSPGIGVWIFTAASTEGSPVASDEGELRWFSPEETGSAPLVEDLGALLPRVTRSFDGGPPFTASYTYDGSGKLLIKIDE